MIHKNALLKTTGIFLVTFGIAGVLLLTSCSGDDATGPQNQQVTAISITPDNAEFAVGEQLDFSVYALTASGDTVDAAEFDIEWQWWSTNPDVFTVEAGGLATGQNPGEAYCVVEAIIEVGQHDKYIPDALFVKAGHSDNITNKIQTVDLKRAYVNQEFPLFENVSSASALRFTGRDSAFVHIF
jgi:hypothetical protein